MVLIASLASPLIISCFFYIALLCSKNVTISNKVSPEDWAQTLKTNIDTIQMQNLTQARSQDLSQAQSLERANSFNEILFKQRNHKYQEQKASAKRSLFTNLFVALVIAVTLMFMVILPQPANLYWILISSVIEKGTLPIVTSVANFGNVKFAFCHYWHGLSM